MLNASNFSKKEVRFTHFSGDQVVDISSQG